MPSATELFSSLQETLGLKKKKPVEAPAAGVRASAAVPTETPILADFAPAPEPTPTMTPEPTATEVPALIADTAAPPATELPDWLQGGQEEVVVAPLPEAPAPIPAPEVVSQGGLAGYQLIEGTEKDGKLLGRIRAPDGRILNGIVKLDSGGGVRTLGSWEPQAAAPIPTMEAPAPLPAVEVEKSQEQLAIEQFEEALLSADEALTRVRAGESLDETQLRAAKAAAAKANGVIRNLPEKYLRVLFASRRLGENRDYTRIDFQKDMLSAIRAFSQTNKG